MKITCIADLHGYLPQLEGGDLLIIAGDITARDKIPEWVEFYSWLKAQNYRQKLLIGGNHDNLLSQSLSTHQARVMGLLEEMPGLENHEYLQDSGFTFEGLNIWGSPWTNWFRGVNPKCKAFMATESVLKDKWALIPDDTDILITHGPPFGVLDRAADGTHCGSKCLADRLLELKLRLHVFGHIHEGYGSQDERHLTVNCSLMNEFYVPVNKPVTIEI